MVFGEEPLETCRRLSALVYGRGWKAISKKEKKRKEIKELSSKLSGRKTKKEKNKVLRLEGTFSEPSL